MITITETHSGTYNVFVIRGEGDEAVFALQGNLTEEELRELREYITTELEEIGWGKGKKR